MRIAIVPVGEHVKVGKEVGRAMGSVRLGRLVDTAGPHERSRIVIVHGDTQCTLIRPPVCRSRPSCFETDHLPA